MELVTPCFPSIAVFILEIYLANVCTPLRRNTNRLFLSVAYGCPVYELPSAGCDRNGDEDGILPR